MAQIVEALGHTGAKSVAIAAATFGLIAGSSMGGPIANRLIRKKNLNVKPQKIEEKQNNDEFLFNNDVKKSLEQ